jgi:hypothetical protein
MRIGSSGLASGSMRASSRVTPKSTMTAGYAAKSVSNSSKSCRCESGLDRQQVTSSRRGHSVSRICSAVEHQLRGAASGLLEQAMQGGVAKMCVHQHRAESEALTDIDGYRSSHGRSAVARTASGYQQAGGSFEHRERRNPFRQIPNRMSAGHRGRHVLQRGKRHERMRRFVVSVEYRAVGLFGLVDQLRTSYRFIVFAHRSPPAAAC